MRSVRRRPFGVRLYLALAFASVALITAGLAYLLVSDTGQQAADEDLTQLAVGRTVGLADEIGNRPPRAAAATLAGITEQGYSAWVFDANGRLLTARRSHNVELLAVPGARNAVQSATVGSRVRPGLSRRRHGRRRPDPARRRNRRRDPRPLVPPARCPGRDR